MNTNTKTNKLPRPFRPTLHRKNWLAGMELNACALRLNDARRKVESIKAEFANMERRVQATNPNAAAVYADAANARLNCAKAKLRDVKQNCGLL